MVTAHGTSASTTVWFNIFCSLARSGYHGIKSGSLSTSTGSQQWNFHTNFKQKLNSFVIKPGNQQPKSGSLRKFQVVWGYWVTTKSYTALYPESEILDCEECRNSPITKSPFNAFSVPDVIFVCRVVYSRRVSNSTLFPFRWRKVRDRDRISSLVQETRQSKCGMSLLECVCSH